MVACRFHAARIGSVSSASGVRVSFLGVSENRGP